MGNGQKAPYETGLIDKEIIRLTNKKDLNCVGILLSNWSSIEFIDDKYGYQSRIHED